MGKVASDKITAEMSRLLEKERAYHVRVDAAALKFLTKVKEDHQQRLRIMDSEIEKLRKENNDAKNDLKEVKFDLRMAERETKKQRDQIGYLRDARREAEEQLKDMKATLAGKEEEIDRLKENHDNISKSYANIEKTKSDLEEKLKLFEEEKKRLSESNEKLKKANEMLKKMCANVETQVTQFQTLYECQVDVKVKMSEEKQRMLDKMNKLEEELQSIEKKYTEQILSMSRAIECLENKSAESEEKCSQLAEELRTTQKSLDEEKQFHLLHENQVPSLISENQLKQHTIEVLQSKLSDREQVIIRLKEEASQHITNNTALNVQNKKLSQALEEALLNNATLQNRIEVTLEEMENKTSEFVREKMKLNETINQQLKLIDMLQEKMEKPKKNWFGLNSPKSTYGHSIPSIQLRELEAALERERAKNKMLVRQIDETKKELRQCKNEIRKYEKRVSQKPGDCGKLHEEENPEYMKQLEDELEAITATSGPSAPPQDIETMSSTSTATTDNNDTSEEEKEFTFSDSVLAELGERKISNIHDVTEL